MVNMIGINNLLSGYLKFKANIKPTIPQAPALCALILIKEDNRATNNMITVMAENITMRVCPSTTLLANK